MGIANLLDMRMPILQMCCLILLTVFNLQSLADFAREEAERRKQLEEQGISGKVIESNTAHPAVDEGMSGPVSRSERSDKSSEHSSSSKGQSSVLKYRTTLQKLDREIKQAEDRLAARQARLQSERWANPKTVRASSRSKPKDNASKLKAEIEELQIKLKQLKEERFQAYEAGRRAGFLPGELDGRYYTP